MPLLLGLRPKPLALQRLADLVHIYDYNCNKLNLCSFHGDSQLIPSLLNQQYSYDLSGKYSDIYASAPAVIGQVCGEPDYFWCIHLLQLIINLNKYMFPTYFWCPRSWNFLVPKAWLKSVGVSSPTSRAGRYYRGGGGKIQQQLEKNLPQAPPLVAAGVPLLLGLIFSVQRLKYFSIQCSLAL